MKETKCKPHNKLKEESKINITNNQIVIWIEGINNTTKLIVKQDYTEIELINEISNITKLPTI